MSVLILTKSWCLSKTSRAEVRWISLVGEYFWQLSVSPDSPFSSPTPPGQRIKMMYPQQSKSEQRTMKIIYLPLAWSSFSLSLRLRHWQGTPSLVMGTSFSWENLFAAFYFLQQVFVYQIQELKIGEGWERRSHVCGGGLFLNVE